MTEKITLLYVDDEHLNLQLFEMRFKNMYNVITAESGIDGLELLKKNPDTKVIVSDMRMPEMSGVEFIRSAKEIYPDKVYFILTAYEINEEINEALNEKLIETCFKKPFNKLEIEQAISKCLN